MKKIWIITFCLIWFNVIGQEKQVYSYPLSSLKQLPILQGCEDLKDSPDDNLECLKKTFEDMFIPYIKDLPKFAKQNALEVYIEFSLTEDGKISMPQRVTVSERKWVIT